MLFTAAFTAPMVVALSVTPAKAQHMSGQQQMQQQSMQHMGQNMQSMQEMMQHMQTMMNRMHGMMQGQQDMMGEHQGMGQQGMTEGQQRMMGSAQGMGSMMGTLNNLGKSMQQFMEQMNNTMSNKTLMDNPGVKKNMEQMQEHMGLMMNSMNGVLNNMEQVQKLHKESPGK